MILKSLKDQTATSIQHVVCTVNQQQKSQNN